MRITYVCNEYPPRPHGGIGTYYQRVARAMARAGHEVAVVGMGDETGQRDDHGVTVHSLRRFPARVLAQFGNRRRLLKWLLRRAHSGAVDIIELPDFQGYLPYPLAGVPVVVRLHMAETIIAANNGGRARYLFRRFERQTLKWHQNWLACSNNVLQRTIDTFGIRPHHAAVVYSPVTNVAPGRTPEWVPENYVLFAGSISRGKGAILLAQAAAEFLERHPELHVIYAGPVVKHDSHKTDEIIRGIVGADRMQRVHFTGRIPNDVILALMQRARAFILPSGLEAFPLVVTEAMAMGCPTITFAIPPYTEFITHLQNGVLVEPHSAPAIAQAVDAIMSHPELGAIIGEIARQKIQSLCSEEAFISSTLEFYESVRSM